MLLVYLLSPLAYSVFDPVSPTVTATVEYFSLAQVQETATEVGSPVLPLDSYRRSGASFLHPSGLLVLMLTDESASFPDS